MQDIFRPLNFICKMFLSVLFLAYKQKVLFLFSRVTDNIKTTESKETGWKAGYCMADQVSSPAVGSYVILT